MGIALADARLLVEKFKLQDRKSELANIMASVRDKTGENRGKKKEKKKRKNVITVQYNWFNWCSVKKKYTQVCLDKGGGRRQHEWHMDTKLSELLNHMKSIFFPKGKNCKGIYCI